MAGSTTRLAYKGSCSGWRQRATSVQWLMDSFSPASRRVSDAALHDGGPSAARARPSRVLLAEDRSTRVAALRGRSPVLPFRWLFDCAGAARQRGVFGAGKTASCCFPLFGSLLALSVLPESIWPCSRTRHLVVMLVYSITSRGSSVCPLTSASVTTQYQITSRRRLHHGALSLTGAMVRPSWPHCRPTLRRESTPRACW